MGSTTVPMRASRFRLRQIDLTLKTPDPTEQDPAETATLESILVVHRGLVHDVFHGFRVALDAIAEEDQDVVAAQDRNRRVLRAHVDHEPVARSAEMSSSERD